MRNSILLSLLLTPAFLWALTAIPMKVSVQTGDTLSFPLLLMGWDTTVTGVTVETSAPRHGSVQSIISWFDSNYYYIPMDTNRLHVGTPRLKTPVRYPGLRYIPEAAFTGLDSFTFRVRTSKDSTAVLTCEVRVTPPEPGGMTVLLVVHGGLLPTVQAEVERLRTDLLGEGYSSRIVSFTPTGITTSEARRLWDTLRTEYNRPGSVLAGAILIGKLPYYSSQIPRLSAFWCMSGWEGDMETAGMVGHRVGVYGKPNQYTPGFMNIWVSCMNGTNSYGTLLGTETELIKRILQSNHDYRTGVSRLPQTAMFFNMYAPNADRMLDARKYLDIWPAQVTHAYNDTTHPFRAEFKRGGEIWEIKTHGNQDYFNALINGSNGPCWRYQMNFAGGSLQDAIVPFRFLLSNNCHAGGFGHLQNSHLLVKNSGCVLTMGATDYVSCGFFLSDTGKTYPPHTWTRRYLAGGDRWGRAWLRGNGWIWSVIFHGDLSLKPKMGPSNAKPLITGVTATKTGTLSWSFTVTASDADDGITAYDWYGNGYDAGRKNPDSSGLSTTFSQTYASAARCTVRVEAVDHYKARDWATVIIKTDSGVVIPYWPPAMAEKSHPSLAVIAPLSLLPNPFKPGTSIRLGLLPGYDVPALLEVSSVDGKIILRQQLELGRQSFFWNGRDSEGRAAASGVYLFRVRTGCNVMQVRGVLTK